MTRIFYLFNYLLILNLENLEDFVNASRWCFNEQYLGNIYFSLYWESWGYKYQTWRTILCIEEHSSNFRVTRRSFLQYTFLCCKYTSLCLARLIILSRRLDVTRIFIATDSIFSLEWRSPRSNFTRAAPAPLWHSPLALRPLIFLPRCCLVLALHPYVPRADPPDRTNFHEIT